MHVLFAGDLGFFNQAKNYENHPYLNQNDTVYNMYMLHVYSAATR